MNGALSSASDRDTGNLARESQREFICSLRHLAIQDPRGAEHKCHGVGSDLLHNLVYKSQPSTIS